MQQHSPLMVVLQDASGQEFAAQLATAMGYSFSDIVVGTPGDAAQAIMARGVSPSYIVLDIGSLPADDVLMQLEQMAEHCDPHTRVVVIGDLNDIRLYRELKTRGVIEYFMKPVEIPMLRSALMSQNPETTGMAAPQRKENCSVITFMSAASGDGSSTVALNTAYALAHEYKQPTVVIDMDYQFGMIARNLDQSSQFGIKDIFEYPDRIIDATLIDKMLVSHLYENNLKVVAAPNDLRILPPIKPEVIRNLITTLKSQFKFIIIDLPHIWSPWVAAALSEANQNVMVAQLWLRSVTHSSRLLKSWREIGIDSKRISIVINRSGAKFKEGVTEKDYERVCGIDIKFLLANDTKNVLNAENQGRTVMEIGGSPMVAQFKDIAGYFAAQQEGGVYTPTPQAPAGGKSSISALFRK
jgi:pilus assembly protein CpaE